MTVLGRALERAAAGRPLGLEDAVALLGTPESRLSELLGAAAAIRDRGRGRRITFSAKVFVPLTTLCRDYCGYCTFRKDPGEPGAFTMTPDAVLALVKAGERLGAKEALFSLGDKPEARFAEHREVLRKLGHRTTLSYLRAVSELVVRESSVLPHANPGLMSERDLSALREVNVSMGIMLETTSERLLGPGLAHDRAPDKVPARRLKTIALAGKLQIPFTTGILIGIGETHTERIESLLAIRDLHDRYGHIQEVIVQNFRAKPTIPMRGWSDPTLPELLRTVAVARLLLGPDMNIQAPPNLSMSARLGSASASPSLSMSARLGSASASPSLSMSARLGSACTSPSLSDEGYGRLPAAGLNDWGGISPLTPDHINPERPWPLLAELRRVTGAAGHELRERLAIYPEYARRPEFVDASLRPGVARFVDAEGLVKPELELWKTW